VVSNGKIYAAGDAALIRYNANGAVDQTFGIKGKVGLPGEEVRKEIITSSGSIYLLLGDITETKVIKLKSNGALDTTFGVKGTSVIDTNISGTAGFGAITFSLAAGKLLIGGVVGSGEVDEIAEIYRINGDGSLDPTFGVDGFVKFQLGITDKTFPDVEDWLAGISALSDGKIMVVGSSMSWYPHQPDLTLDSTIYGNEYLISARLTSTGRFDKSYGANGISRVIVPAGQTLYRSTDPEIGGNDFAFYTRSVGTINSDGSTIVVGEGLELGAAKFDASGKVLFDTANTPGFQLYIPSAMTMLPDGRAVITGVPNTHYLGHGPVFVELFPDGSFGPYRLTDDLNSSTDDLIDYDPQGGGNNQYIRFHPVAVAPDGELLIGGSPQTGSGFEIEKFQVGNIHDPLPNLFPGGTANSLKLDKDMGLHLTYFDANSKSLKYAYRAVNGLWSAPVTVDSTQFAGTYLSLAVDDNDQPSIAYFDAIHGDLKFASSTNLGKTWKLQTIDSKGSTGLYPSLVIDSAPGGNGQVMIAYYRKTSGDLRFAAEKPDGSWGIENIDAAGDVGRSCELYQSFDYLTPTPVVVYSDSTTNEVKFGMYQKGGKWQLQTVTTTKGGADFYSIDYGRDSPAISFYDAYSGDLDTASRINPATDFWDLVTTASKGITGLYTSSAFYVTSDPTEHAQVYAYDKTTDSVDYFSGADLSTDEVPLVLIANAGRYLSIAHDPSLQIGAGDAAFLDSNLNALRVGTVLSPIDDIIKSPLQPPFV
jgi:uncharacterized delta-60 repeat protein